MKEVLISAHPLTQETVDSPIPEPKNDEVLIKVVVSGSNPKDWKYPGYMKKAMNPGDDIAGYIESVGSDVYEFKKGDRVAAFHVMLVEHGSFAEYAIAPQHTTFLIPPNISFEEAATVPLAAMTAAIGLYQRLELPTPWRPAIEPIPLIVYGGSSAVGAFTIKLAKLSNLSPIIAVAGGTGDFVKNIGADVVIDYRNGNVTQELKEALNGKKCYHAFDAISEHGSYVHVGPALEPGAGLVVLLKKDMPDFPEGIQKKWTYVGSAYGARAKATEWPHDDDFAHAMYRFFSRALADGRLQPHPYTVHGGLESVADGLQKLYENKVRASKLVFRVAEN